MGFSKGSLVAECTQCNHFTILPHSRSNLLHGCNPKSRLLSERPPESLATQHGACGQNQALGAKDS